MNLKLSEAITILLFLLTILSANAGPQNPQFGDEFIKAYKAGYEKLEVKQYDDALKSFQTAAKIAKGNHEKGPVYTRIGECLYGENKWQEAADAFQQAIQCPIPGKHERNLHQQKHIQDAFGFLIEIYSKKLKDIDKAKEVLKAMGKFEGVHPHQVVGHMKRLSEGCLHQKDYDRATKIISEALLIEGMNDDHRGDLICFQARIYEHSGKFELALTEYRKASELPKIHPHRACEATLNTGKILSDRLKKYDEALKWFDKAVKIEKAHSGHHYEALRRSGNIYENIKKQPDKAREFYSKAGNIPKLHPHNKCDAQWHIAQSYLREKNKEKAREELKKLLAMKGLRDNNRKRAENELKKLDK